MMYKIYALIDPRTDDVRYIGQTSQTLEVRLSKHLVDRRQSPRASWINSLKTQGLKPSIKLIEEGDWSQEECDSREISWIAWGRETIPNLTNLADGGSTNRMSDEQRKIHSDRMKQWHADNPEKRYNAGVRHHSPESKRRISDKAKAQWSDPAKLEAKSEQMKKSTKTVWDNLSQQERKNRGHKISLGRRYLYATRRGLALEVVS